MKIIKSLLLLLVSSVILFSSVNVQTVLAVDEEGFRSLNNESPFYDPFFVECASVGSSTSLQGNDNIEKAFRFFIDPARGLTAAQSAGIVGNLMVESGVNPLRQQGDKSTSKLPIPNTGFGIAQWTSAGRQKGLVDFAKNHQPPGEPGDLGIQLEYLWYELNGPEKASLVALNQDGPKNDYVQATTVFMEKFERPGIPHLDKRIANAKAVLDNFGNTTSNPTNTAQQVSNPSDTYTGTSCATSNSSSAIAQTALSLAWQDGQNHGKTPTDAYRAAWNGASDMTDCGAFVATVMARSNVDPNYPKVGTTIQYVYVKKHPELYQIFEKDQIASIPGGFQDGDILIVSNATTGGGYGHTMIYAKFQNEKGTYVTVDGSLGDHTPQVGTQGNLNAMLRNPGVIVARYNPAIKT